MKLRPGEAVIIVHGLDGQYFFAKGRLDPCEIRFDFKIPYPSLFEEDRMREVVEEEGDDISLKLKKAKWMVGIPDVQEQYAREHPEVKAGEPIQLEVPGLKYLPPGQES